MLVVTLAAGWVAADVIGPGEGTEAAGVALPAAGPAPAEPEAARAPTEPGAEPTGAAEWLMAAQESAPADGPGVAPAAGAARVEPPVEGLPGVSLRDLELDILRAREREATARKHVVPLPEPGTLALAGAGAAALVVRRRRR
jgi:hypothetical protein